METTCSGCNVRINIPDDKIPRGQTVSISCPRCKNKIPVEHQDMGNDPHIHAENHTETGGSDHKFTEPAKKRPEEQTVNEDMNNDYALEYYDDSKIALVMADERINSLIKPAVEENGYKFITAPTIRESLLKLRFHHFELMILLDGFDGQEIAGGPIINYLNHMAMSGRRRIFLAAIGDKYRTMDEIMAYTLSANMVVNTKDLENFQTLLRHGIMDYRKFYKVFFDILEEEGKM